MIAFLKKVFGITDGWIPCCKRLPENGETVSIKIGNWEGVGYISPFTNLWQNLASNAMTTDFNKGLPVEYWREKNFKRSDLKKMFKQMLVNPAHFDWKRPYKSYDAGHLMSILNKDGYDLMVEDTSFRIHSPLPPENIQVLWFVKNGSRGESGRCETMEEGRIQCQNAFMKLIGMENKKQSHTISNHH